MSCAELITDSAGLREFYGAWDELALQNGLPMMAPACVMSWWRQMAPPAATPRAVVLRDGSRLLGIAPLYASARPMGRVDVRLPGIELAARLGPLALPGHELALSQGIVGALWNKGTRTDLLLLEGVPAGAPWVPALSSSLPRRRLLHSYRSLGSPTVGLATGSFEQWLSGKSSNFRSQMGRMQRRFEAAGGTVRMSAPETLAADVDTFVRLHAARWQDRGQSKLLALKERLPAWLCDMGRELLAADGRFRLQLLEMDGAPVSAQLFLAAGGRVLYVNGGWDERFAQFKPPMLAILQAIREGFERGDEQLDLGIGEQPYKLRFADGRDEISWTLLAALGARVPVAATGAAPLLARSAARRALRRVRRPPS